MAQFTQPFIPPVDLVGLYPYKSHPWTAQKLVSELERRTIGAQRWLEDNNWDAMVDSLFEGVTVRKPLLLPADPLIHHHATMTAQELSVHRLWNENRIVMDIHPGMIPYLRASDSDKFPPMVLKNLPYPNPLVTLGRPVELEDSAGKPIRLLGWYVAGMTRNLQYVDTTDDRATAFHITTVSEVMTDDGASVVDWDYCRVTLPVIGADATLGELIEAGLNRFRWDPMIQGQTENQQQRYMAALLKVIVPHMLYLVAQNLETKPKPFHAPAAPRRNKWDRKQGGGMVSRYLVGWQSGAVLASPEHWGDEVTEPGESRGSQGVKRPPRAHVRRAHFHTYWAGKGSKEMTPEERMERAEKRVKWLSPIPVNTDNKPGAGTVTQAIKVR